MTRAVRLANGCRSMCICRCQRCGHAAFSHHELRGDVLECRYCECSEHVGCGDPEHCEKRKTPMWYELADATMDNTVNGGG